MKVKGILGCIFILASGVLYTIERYLAILEWSVLTTPVLENGGGYLNSPDMPNIKTNLFVLLFLILGVIFLLFEIHEICNKNRQSK